MELRGEPKKLPPQNIRFILDRARKEQEETIAKIFEIVQKKPYPTPETTQLATFIHSMFQTGPLIGHPKLKKKVKEEERLKAEETKLKRQGLKIPKGPKLPPLPMAPSPHRVEVEPDIPLADEIPIMHEPELPALVPPKLPPLERPEKLKVPELPPLEKKEELKVPELPAKEAPKPAGPKGDIPEVPKKHEKKEYVVNLFGTPVGVLVAADDKTYKTTYRVIEPVIDDKVLAETKELIKNDFQKDYKILDNQDYLGPKVQKACKKSGANFTPGYTKKIQYYLKRDLSGFRRIDPLMQDKHVKAIYVNGVNKPVIVEFKDFSEKIESNVIFTDPTDLNVLISKIARVTNNEISEKKPILDTVFEGFRIQATKGVGGASSKLIIKKVML